MPASGVMPRMRRAFALWLVRVVWVGQAPGDAGQQGVGFRQHGRLVAGQHETGIIAAPPDLSVKPGSLFWTGKPGREGVAGGLRLALSGGGRYAFGGQRHGADLSFRKSPPPLHLASWGRSPAPRRPLWAS